MAHRLNNEKTDQDSAQPEFWSTRYASGRTPWQLDRVPERLETFIRSLPEHARILVPGCGEDYRTLEAFSRAGHEITAIDFSPVAVEQTKIDLPQFRDRIILGDFFRHDFGEAKFDLVYERTFLCSLPPRLWNHYPARVAQLLRPGGMLAGFFFYGEETDPPPYPLTAAKATELFGGRFLLLKSEPVSDSLPVFGGNEKWQEWKLQT